ncbi:MAG: putative short-chain type dehydrogenase/reductase [Solirubrobacterales bacterium]|nr:putative short-chain type dehydrogenase/reductase [Solirubrobacterales bacterium]
MGTLQGRVAVITGAGNGIGREHALLFAAEGAKVVVNDLGGNPDGTGADASAAQKVVDEIVALGGEAVANHDDVADWAGAASLIAQAVQEYGRLDVLVNNAGILRDAFLHKMTEDEWDLVVRVHLKGHFATLRHATDHWRERSKAGEDVKGAVINTASASGIVLPNPGQVNYGSAKAAIAAMTLVAAAELGRLGVRVNAIAPAARTRLTADVPGFVGELMKAPEDPSALDVFGPHQISPLVAYLAAEHCPHTGKLFAVQGGAISELHGWTSGEVVETDSDWTIASVGEKLGAGAAV